jgi:phosphoribosylformimino-5-aminoimidazole carboxamide ribotide isomerase
LQVIPVIDLMQGQVVHAKFGLRSQYQPIQSSLCNGSSPLAIVAALLKLYPFQTLYIADLDAILGVGNHTELIELISKTYPQLTIWLDSGIRQANTCALYKTKQIKLVIGSENIANLQDYRAINKACKGQHILSLDYAATSQLGINELHESARFWPDNTICMTLNAVGSAQGVDINRLNTLIQLNKRQETPSKIYAAGGVRNPSDLELLTTMGITGVLVASALHNQKISAQDLQHVHQTQS